MREKIKNFIEGYFHLEKNNTTIKTEIIAAITNYFTLLYMLTLVPEVIMGAFPGAVNAEGEIVGNAVLSGGITASQMLTAITAVCFVAAGIGSVLMGMFVNVPFIQGPSLTISTFVVYVVCRGFGYTYSQALAIIFISGICFFVMAYTGVEKKLHKAIPKNLKYAVSAGVGMFIAYTGLIKAHIIHYSGNSIVVFDLTAFSDPDTVSAYLAIFGIVLITILLKKHVHSGIFIGKIVCMILAVPLGLLATDKIKGFDYSFNLSQVVFKADFKGLLDFSDGKRLFFSLFSIIAILFSVCIMDIFETMTMLIATREFIKKSSKERNVNERIPKILEIDAASTSIGSLLGTTTVSTYIESTAGVIEGGRTGLTAVITGVLFILSASAAPLASLMPSAATATTLVVAGILMMRVIKYIDFTDEAEAVSAFFTMFLMPLTSSLIVGLSFGIIMYLLIHIFMGKGRKVNYIMYILGILFCVVLIFLPRHT